MQTRVGNLFVTLSFVMYQRTFTYKSVHFCPRTNAKSNYMYMMYIMARIKHGLNLQNNVIIKEY